jgi:hypothetical protein
VAKVEFARSVELLVQSKIDLVLDAGQSRQPRRIDMAVLRYIVGEISQT